MLAIPALFDFLEKRAAGLRLPELVGDERLSSLRDLFAFLGMLQKILTRRNEVLRLDHDEMLPRDECAVAFAGLGDDAATVSQTDQHPVPLEIFLLGVMEVEQNAGLTQQFVAPLGAEITPGGDGLGEAKRNQSEMAWMFREKIGMTGEELLPALSH